MIDSATNERFFESQTSGLNPQLKNIVIDLRSFVTSLGTNVIEEIRPHRIVYAKSINFRTFLDIRPEGDHIELKLTAGRGASNSYHIADDRDIPLIKEEIQRTYSQL
ncbi:MAG: hypothetical protein WB511_04640 [Nitrososphaeraceae archaeon]